MKISITKKLALQLFTFSIVGLSAIGFLGFYIYTGKLNYSADTPSASTYWSSEKISNCKNKVPEAIIKDLLEYLKADNRYNLYWENIPKCKTVLKRLSVDIIIYKATSNNVNASFEYIVGIKDTYDRTTDEKVINQDGSCSKKHELKEYPPSTQWLGYSTDLKTRKPIRIDINDRKPQTETITPSQEELQINYVNIPPYNSNKYVEICSNYDLYQELLVTSKETCPPCKEAPQSTGADAN